MSLLDVLGSKPRLRMIRELTEEPRYVSELADRVDLDGKSTVHHLSVLEEAGLVESYWTGQRKYFRLTQRIDLTASPSPERTFVLSTSECATPAVPDGGDERRTE
jgi:predicted transcriptional regulator